MSDVQNVLIIVVDALRADRVNEENNLTPNIDEFADSSVRFTNAFTCINATDPAVTSLQTGRYPLSHGILHHGWHVTDKEKARVNQVSKLPEILNDNGLNTINTGRNMGRWHRSGFETIQESNKQTQKFKTSKRRFEQRVGDVLSKISPRLYRGIRDVYTNYIDKAVMQLSPNNWRDNNDTKSEVEAFLEAVDEPFYGYLHLMDTHTPYTPPEELVEECLQTRTYEERGKSAYDVNPSNPWLIDRVGEWGIDDLGKITARYDAAIKHADSKIGELLSWLDKRELTDETLIVILSDHGELLGEHDVYFDHHCLYDPVIRIPLVVSTPDAKSNTTDKFVQITDIMPTVLDYLDFEEAADMDGQSLQPLITGATNNWNNREFILSEEAHTQRKRTIRTENYKLIKTVGDNEPCRYCERVHAKSTELYNLETDPRELNNIKEEQPEPLKILSNTIEETVSEFKAPDIDENEAIKYEDEDTVEEQLRALGYR